VGFLGLRKQTNVLNFLTIERSEVSKNLASLVATDKGKQAEAR